MNTNIKFTMIKKHCLSVSGLIKKLTLTKSNVQVFSVIL